MRATIISTISALLTGLAVCRAAFADAPPAAPTAQPSPASFHQEVRPILLRRCHGCHQPAKAGGKLDATTYEALVAGGKRGAGVTPGKPAESLLILYVTGEKKPQMPKGEPPLPPEEIALLTRWVAEGARDDTPPGAKVTFDPSRPPVYAAPPVVSALAFSPDGATLATAGYHEVILHRLPAPATPTDTAPPPERIARLVGMADRLESIIFTKDGKRLIAAGGSPCRFGEVQVWNLEDSTLLRSVLVGFDTLYGASLSDDEKLLAIGTTDKSVQVLDLEEGKVLRRIDQHEDWVFGTGFSKDRKHLITCSRDRTVKLIEADTGSFIDNLTSITPGVLGGPLYALARHPAEDKFLTGGEDGVPKLYKTVRTAARQIGDDNNLLKAYEPLPGVITCLAVSADGKRFAAGSIRGAVRVHDLESGARLGAADLPGAVYTVRFHPAGDRVAIGGFDGQVRILEAATGKAVSEFIPVPIGEGKVAREF
jgi:mono/diheme cytochrome c family protein